MRDSAIPSRRSTAPGRALAWLLVALAWACSSHPTGDPGAAADLDAQIDAAGLTDTVAADAGEDADAAIDTAEDATAADVAPPVDATTSTWSPTCFGCHGTKGKDNPAPPKGTNDETLVTDAAVGAHQKHLGASAWHRRVQCQDCHLVPKKVPHANDIIDFAWSGPAVAGGAQPNFAADALTCSGAWCHGALLFGPPAGGDVLREPVWNQVDGTFKQCGQACHNTPPGPPHPANSNCAACHGAVIASFDPATQEAVWADATRHIDGVVDAPALTCTTCHGNAQTADPAPPTATHGETATSAAGVGAHQAHLQTADWHKTVTCTACHSVPSQPLHANGVDDVAFADLATANGATPVFAAATLTCNGAYCHGATLPASSSGNPVAKAPKWTQVDGTFNACGQACHTTPPTANHPQNSACETCHGEVISAFDPATPKATWAAPQKHIDGKVQVIGLTCTTCHGDAATQNPAPPKGTHGETATSDVAVGAHAAHLTLSGWHRQVACTDCHEVPAVPQHADGVVKLTFGVVALAKGATPTFDAATASCSGAYCHGTTLAGSEAALTQPQWTQVNGSFNACGKACHTTPPGGSHPQSTQCNLCHGEVIAAWDPSQQLATWQNPALHVDGQVQVTTLTCTTCHGDAATSQPAPPWGVHGESATTTVAVGAHSQHLASSAWHRQVQCGDCHAVPASVLHANDVVDWAWSGPAMANGASPAWEAGAATCQNAGCHGAALANTGSAKVTPVWTAVDGSFKTCGAACHMTPPGGTHPQSAQCQLCHGAVISGFDAATQQAKWLDPTQHIDGKVDVTALTCTTCHGSQDQPAPPNGTHGETATTTLAVGAHTSHLSASTWHRQVQCADCHTVPTAQTHTNGVVEMTWGGPSLAGDATPSLDVTSQSCSNVWCHGAATAVAVNSPNAAHQPTWTQVDGTFKTCGQACHMTPPAGAHPQSAQCQLCHGAVVSAFDPPTQSATWLDATLHINGQIDVVDLSCTTCHGNPQTQNPAPPKGTHGETQTSERAVGAHAQHLATASWHRQVQCGDCHVVPTAKTHTDGVVQLDWSGPALAGGAQPVFDGAALTCSGAWCHGAMLPAQTALGLVKQTPKWTEVDGAFNSCGQACHGAPPGLPHPQNPDCAACHGAVIKTFDPVSQTATWADASRHIDGVLDAPALACTACHGDPATANPAPPSGPQGEQLTTTLAVGAHTAHLAASEWHRPVQCGDCHVVPTQQLHANGIADLAWSAVAMADGATPVFDAAAATCSGGYCHGATLPAKAGVQPVVMPKWTDSSGATKTCGAACHTLPPGGQHPTSTACEMCHSAVIASFDPVSKTALWVNGGLHIDGKVDVVNLTCTTCHGDATTQNPAPPKGTHGETATTSAGVGAHASHVSASAWHRQVQCSDCHVVPTAMGHSNGQVDLAWGGPTSNGGAKPSFDAGTLGCSGTWCHGAQLWGPPAGTSVATTPTWTQVDGSFKSCGQACHSTPPGPPHGNDNQCQKCHGDVIASFDPATQTAVWQDATRHIDGVIDAGGESCTACHGDAAQTDPAPPNGSHGETATTALAVGAHQQHQGASTWHRPMQCTDCHVMPTVGAHADGIDDVVWGAVALAGGQTPTFTPATATCSSVACHGAGTAKTASTVAQQPLWTQVDGTFNQCGLACHTTPPGGTHPVSTQCQLCHTDVIAAFNPTTQTAAWLNPGLHVDGIVQVRPLACTTCHGDAATDQPAPPKGTHGETSTATAAVGAHSAHLAASGWHRQVACADCHNVPTAMTHADDVVDFAFAGPAVAAGAQPSFDANALTCTGAYCHGTTLGADKTGVTARREPTWTQVDGTFNSCGQACHTTPPGGSHPNSTQCQLCHDDIGAFDPATQAATWSQPQRHIDGVVQMKTLACTSCHGDAASNQPAPPTGTHGETATTAAAVGAHASHLSASTWHRQVACGDCHVVPTAMTHTDGAVQLDFAGPAVAGNATPVFDGQQLTCSGAWCHGAQLLAPPVGLAVATTPTWTQVDGTFNSCGQACHSTPPGPPHPASTACQTCHGAVIGSFDPLTQTATWTDPARHIDGIVDAPALTCTTCHGNAATGNPAPPLGPAGETLTNQPAVGAHAAHLSPSSWHRQVQCAECHNVPSQNLHANGQADVAFSGPALTGGAQPSFDAQQLTCTGAWCHGGGMLPGLTGQPLATVPNWTQVDGTFNACGQACHTTPPGGTHPASTQCQICHGSVISALTGGQATWLDPSLHVDGTVQVTPYHGLGGWVAAKFNADGSVNGQHHGLGYFLANHGIDDKGAACTSCHGANLDGGAVNINCNNATINCHGKNAASNGTAGDWKACNFCHGTATQQSPPAGVWNEQTTATLAVGAHAMHLQSTATHVALTCDRCHAIPAAGDTAHTQQYLPSTDLSAAGHHGDITLPAPPSVAWNTGAMVWNVAATLGAPVTARGACTGACHSNGRAGAPVVAPYWAGGTWTDGSCASCHLATMTSGWHTAHTSGENNNACTVCHPAASSPSHVNGVRDVFSTIVPSWGTGLITNTRPTGGNCANRVQCSGICHAQDHSQECWK